ncbi:acyltransferase-domain-containing protein [Terfezia claveryi]|nr:acyltransferase-domain-containing protein [Terfezia claveryi]
MAVDKVAVLGEPKVGHNPYLRMVTCAIYFVGGILWVFLTQCLGAPLYFINKTAYYTWMARTKANFGVLVTTLTQWWSPTVVTVTGDRDVRDQIRLKRDGRLELDFPERIVFIANHQLYSDWLYLWWIAYTAKMHSFMYIILKESLKSVPVIGQGMLFFGFIFLARKWEQDKPRFEHRLNKLSKGEAAKDPMWLLIFPEGTNASENGRKTSAKYAQKIGVQDLKHTLLPRSTGLAFCLRNLEKSVEWMYDCTVAYEGVPEGKFGQDYFTLFSTYFEGRPPKSVNMHFRKFRISDIPIHDAKQFDLWLRERWVEKDDLMEYYNQHGRFPEDESKVNGTLTDESTEDGGVRKRVVKSGVNGNLNQWKGPIETEVKLESTWEVFSVFSTLLTAGLLVHIIRTIWKLIFKITMAAAEVAGPVGDLPVADI